ncbi:MAG TPA: T9SS type A sorting domain-containing protein [Cytophagaceae bacterium]|jgi:hypothetical protein|nr:T9SS type A sorting domain-containing protein [Cytophagaceae bacterium]
MKKLLLLLISIITLSTGFAQTYVTFSASPVYGCPNTTHDVNVTVKNVSGINLPAGASSYSFSVTFYDTTGGGQTILGSTYTSPTYTDGVANGASKTVTVPNIPFVGAMVCSVYVALNYTYGVPGSFPVSANYTVQSPPNLTIAENPTGTVSLTTTLDAAYSTQFYLNGGSSAVNTSTTGSYTPTVSGTYTAKAYEAYNVNTVPSTVGCISAIPSGPVTISVTTAIIAGQNANVSVYPNPMTSSLTISTGISYKLTYELSDMNGALLRASDFTSVANVNVESLKAGTYLLVVKDNNSKIASYKLVK